MLIGTREGDNREPAAIVARPGQFRLLSDGQWARRGCRRASSASRDTLEHAQGARSASPLEGEAADELGLVTVAYEDFDWDDELRVMLEERTSFSPDAMTGMEANLRFAGPETMETKIFGRLTAWQNWIFQRPNAIGEQGALEALRQRRVADLR